MEDSASVVAGESRGHHGAVIFVEVGGLMLEVNDALFFGFALVAALSAVLVIFVKNPIYSALFLALTMCVLGAMYFTLDAYFVAVAQITVYAGAVMVLFVMVVMLFDLKRETEEILKVSPVTLAKIVSVALLCGFLVGTGWLAINGAQASPAMQLAPNTTAADLAKPTEKQFPAAAAPGKFQSGDLTAAARKDQAQEAGAQAGNPPSNPPGKTEAPGILNTPINPDEDLTAAEAAKLVEGTNDGAQSTKPHQEQFGSTVALSQLLFSKYIFAFEAVSVLLLIAIVGAVALAKSKGGTHHVAR
jgi:NADH:ubiquinone oxidoreductase subunit 6 (subunit J)